MSDSVRKSSRATKGQHTKDRDLPDTPVPKRASKAQSKKTKEPEPEPEPAGDEEEAIIRCICGSEDDDEGGRMMICCENCDAWQHNDCMGVIEDAANLPAEYYCELCHPDDHPETVQALQSGIKIWEDRLQEKADRKSKGKKGKKASRKSRPSEVRTATAEAASSPAPVSRQASTKQESEEDGANGNVEIKSPSEPAAGEKRRNEATNDPTPKRRKSSQVKKTTELVEAPKPTTIEDLPQDRAASARTLRDALAKRIAERTKQGYRIPDGETPSSLGSRHSLAIENALMMHFPEGPNASAYKTKLRTIYSGIRDNEDLLMQILDGSLPAEKLVSMDEAGFRTEERNRKLEDLRKQNERANVLVQEEGPRFRKTHKGDEIIEENKPADVEPTFAPPAIPRRESQVDKRTAPISPTDEGAPGSPMAVELPEDVGTTSQPLRVDTSQPGAPARRTSSSFNMDSVWSSVKSPDENQRAQQQHMRRKSSGVQPQNQNGPGEDPDIDRLLENNDEDIGGPFSPTADPEASIKWKGEITMQNIGAFDAVARFAGGADIGPLIPYSQLIPQPPVIDGRIDMVRTEDYIRGMRNSQAHDVVILSLTPESTDGKTGFDAVFNYFHPRGRWGVISHGTRHATVRDVYVIPIPAGMGPLPECITLLENLQLELPIADNLLLLMLVVKTGDLTGITNSAQGTPRQVEMTPSSTFPPPAHLQHHPSAQAPTPHVPTPMVPFGQAGPYHSPVTGHGSPMAHQAPMPPGFGNPLQPPPPQQAQQPSLAQMQMHMQTPVLPEVRAKAEALLGPLMNSPTVLTLMQYAGPIMTDESLQGLKQILEDVPAARADVGTLMEQLNKDRQK